MAPSSSVRVEVKYTFCDFIVIDTRDNFESFNHITSEASVFKVGIFNFFSLSGYSISFKDGICLVALLCTFSMLSMSCCFYGDQTAAAYSWP
jgi:hypothetical protein